MLCYVMLCYVMLCYVMLCYVHAMLMLCSCFVHAMLCYDTYLPSFEFQQNNVKASAAMVMSGRCLHFMGLLPNIRMS